MDMEEKFCFWTRWDDNPWESGCSRLADKTHHVPQGGEGTPTNDEFKFCPWCGKEIYWC